MLYGTNVVSAGIVAISLACCVPSASINAQQPNQKNEVQPNKVPRRGQVSSEEMIITWSLDKGEAAGISTQLGGNWVRIRLATKSITEPQVAEKVAAFYSGNMLYAFSARTGTWDVTKLDQQIGFSLQADSVVVKTDDDLHVFSSAAGRWFSRSKSQLQRPPSVDPFSDDTFDNTDPANLDPFGDGSVEQPFADPFGDDGSQVSNPSNDPFGTGDGNNDPFGGDPFGSNSTSPGVAPKSSGPFDSDTNPGPGVDNPFGGDGDDPFGGAPRAKGTSDRDSTTAHDDPFAAASKSVEAQVQDSQNRLNQAKNTHAQVEAKISQLAKSYKSETDQDKRTATAKEIAAWVTRSFETRQVVQMGELHLLERKMRLAAMKIQSRRQKRDAYVRSRTRQLTGNPGITAEKQ